MTPAERARIATEEEIKKAFEKQPTSSEQQAKDIISILFNQENKSIRLATIACSDMTYNEVSKYRILIQASLRKLGKKLNTGIDPIPSHYDKSRVKGSFTIFFSTEKLGRKRTPK